MEKFITFENIAAAAAPEQVLATWSDTPALGGDKKSICFWHTKEPISNYSLKDYLAEYGSELIEVWDDEIGRTRFYTIAKYLKSQFGIKIGKA